MQEYQKHRAVGQTTENEEAIELAEKFTAEELAGREIIEKDGKKYIKILKEKKGF